ncbi:M28 family peptidase [Pantoea sp.]|uniref:M28 family peptidase n=1 Tax=Pantoea sp. TaxID=69393 RepID=UPI0031D6A59E
MLPNELQLAMRQLLEKFQHWHRLSGSADAEHSIDWLCDFLQQRQISFHREYCRLWLSDPLSASLTLNSDPDWHIPAKTRSFSADCPQGVEAELVYDDRALTFIADCERTEWENRMKGKIVVADQGYEDYVQRLMQAGAAGLIHIWGSAESALHEETVGPIWGSPVPDDLLRYPTLPVISINQQDGKALLERMQQPLRANIITVLHEHIARCSLPIIELPGETEEFVLLSSHYDSWHQGVTDNATGNALCLALALHYAQNPEQLRRGLRIAFWPGHSNGRYAGSSWYADHFRDELVNHCVAHINVDSPGCVGGSEVVINASGAESVSWLNQAVEKVTGLPASRISPLGKGGDQSFWGVGIPLHFALREEPALRSSLSPGSGGGWWWHTEQDTLDKVDDAHLWRDVKIHQHWLDALLMDEVLPLDASNYLHQLRSALTQLQYEIDPAFSLQPIDVLLERLILEMGSKKVSEKAFGLWHRARYRASDDFHPDLSFHGGAFPGLQLLRGHRQENCSERYWLMLETQFVRQRDRLCELFALSLQLILHEIG